MERIHFIGIKGTGMSALALLLKDIGYEIQGSDYTEYFFTEDKLIENGIKIYNLNEDKITKEMIIVVGNAFLNHLEHQTAIELGCEIYTYQEIVSLIAQNNIAIGVTGTHGKTTTTSIIANIFKSQRNTSYLIGEGTGMGVKNSQFFIFEACEYRRNFLSYFPDLLVISNIEYDHPDYYTSLNDVKSAFNQAAQQANIVVVNGDDKNIDFKHSKIITFGLKDHNDYQGYDIQYQDLKMIFKVRLPNNKSIKITTKLVGEHNVYNILSAIAVSDYMQLEIDKVVKSIENFDGVTRRFEEHQYNEQILINDYAHHPTEIKAAINAVRMKYPDKKLVVLFQPHTFTRTETFLNEFGEALSLADKVYLYEIFASAREHQGSITIEDLVSKIEKSEIINKEMVVEIFNKLDECVIIFMGAGITDKLMFMYMQQ